MQEWTSDLHQFSYPVFFSDDWEYTTNNLKEAWFIKLIQNYKKDNLIYSKVFGAIQLVSRYSLNPEDDIPF